MCRGMPFNIPRVQAFGQIVRISSAAGSFFPFELGRKADLFVFADRTIRLPTASQPFALSHSIVPCNIGSWEISFVWLVGIWANPLTVSGIRECRVLLHRDWIDANMERVH